MENATYATLSRQMGLMSELRVVANNIANANTTGFQREGLLFAEHIAALDGNHDSLSLATSLVKVTDQSQGTLTQTGGTFDLAIEGTGFFLIETPAGERLDPLQLVRESGTMFESRGGFEEAPNARMVQGFLENSNVNPISQISRMIEVQRAYELGQSFLDKEDERIRSVIRAIGQ